MFPQPFSPDASCVARFLPRLENQSALGTLVIHTITRSLDPAALPARRPSLPRPPAHIHSPSGNPDSHHSLTSPPEKIRAVNVNKFRAARTPAVSSATFTKWASSRSHLHHSRSRQLSPPGSTNGSLSLTVELPMTSCRVVPVEA
jgi:hypothetical protein